MARLKTALLFLMLAGFAASFSCSAASGQDAGRDFRIGLINQDPGRLVRDFEPFEDYLEKTLHRSGIRKVDVFVARDLDQLRRRFRKGRLDFILTSAFPVLDMEQYGLIPALAGMRGAAREEESVFFVRKRSSLHRLDDLRGKKIVFGYPWSTTGYALARADLNRNRFILVEPSQSDAPGDAVRYEFAGESINQAFRVIQYRADAGVIDSSDWDALSPAEQSRLRIIHRTPAVTRLLGSFHPAVPPALRKTITQAFVDMSGSRRGQAALTRALNVTSLERITEEDNASLRRLQRGLAEGTNDENIHQ